MRTLIWRGQKNDILAKKGRKWPKRFFEKFWVEGGNLSNLANWIKNHCFSYGFFIDNGQKTYEKIRKNWI